MINLTVKIHLQCKSYGLDPGLGPVPGGNGDPLKYFLLKSMDRKGLPPWARVQT